MENEKLEDQIMRVRAQREKRIGETEVPEKLYFRIACKIVPNVFKEGADIQPRPDQSSLSPTYRANGFSHLLAEAKVVSKEAATNWLAVQVVFPEPTDPAFAGRLEPVPGREGFWLFSGPILSKWVKGVKVEWTAVFKSVSKTASLDYATRARVDTAARRKKKKVEVAAKKKAEAAEKGKTDAG